MKSDTTAVLSRTESAGIAARLKVLAGSGDRIALLTLPVLAIGLILNVLRPDVFSVGGPPAALRALSIGVLIPGVVLWLWSVWLILTRVPRGELITAGPFSLVKHPLYTSVALLVVPWVGFLLDSWLGLVVGAVLYLAVRLFAGAEERSLAETFGASWDAYVERVRIPWL